MNLHLEKTTWKRVAFGDVVKNVNETVKDPTAEGINRIIAMEHLDPGELKVGRWGEVADGTTFTRRVRPGQTLFGKRRAYQRKAALAEFDAICSGDILVFEADATQMLPEFLPFLVQSDGFYGHALGTSAGSLSPRTNWRDLSDYEFDLPPLDEQERVVNLLWAVEADVQASAELAMRNDAVRQSFIDGYFARARGTAETKRLDAVTTKIADGVHKRPTYVEHGIPFLTVENLTRGRGIDFGKVRYVSPEDHRDFTKRTRPERGDVLVSKDGTLGVARVVETDQEFSIFVSVALLKPRPEMLNSRYLCSYFDSADFKSTLAAKTSGSALKHIHLVDFRSALIPVPSLSDQEEFVRMLVILDSGTDSLNSRKRGSGDLKSLVMREVFEVRP